MFEIRKAGAGDSCDDSLSDFVSSLIRMAGAV